MDCIKKTAESKMGTIEFDWWICKLVDLKTDCFQEKALALAHLEKFNFRPNIVKI